jgi:hypothetical protein
MRCFTQMLYHAFQLRGYRRPLASSQILDLLGGVLDVCFIETACAQQRGGAFRPFDEISFLERLG